MVLAAQAEQAWLIVDCDHTVLPLRNCSLNEARRFYVWALGMIEVAVPAGSDRTLLLRAGPLSICMQEVDHGRAQSVTLTVSDLGRAAERLQAYGWPTRWTKHAALGRIVETRDPAGNTLRLVTAR